MVRFGLVPLLKDQMMIRKLEVPISLLVLLLEVCNGKPTNRKSWTGNILMWSDLTLGLLQGQMRVAKLKSPITCLFLFLIEVWNVKPTYKKLMG